MFFRGAELKALASESPGPASPTEHLSVDPVLDELRRWDGMGVKEYEKFISTDGLLNEVCNDVVHWRGLPTPLHCIQADCQPPGT